MTIPAEVLNNIQQNGIIWEIQKGLCQSCGCERVYVNIVFLNTGGKICVANVDNNQIAVNFISDLKRAGIIVHEPRP